MQNETATQGSLLRLGLGVLIVFSGLCTIFASVVTITEAWQEHAQTRWPEVTGQVETCGLQRTSSGLRKRFYIHCRLSYAVGADQSVANIYSRNVPSPEVWQYPPNQIGPFEEWVQRHPAGTPVSMRYNPDKHAKVMLVVDYMPGGGPRTPSNVRLVEFLSGSFLVLLLIARITRP